MLIVFKCHDRNVVVWATLSTNATADATLSDIDFTAWQACDTSTATEHTHGVLALAAGGGNANVADDHAFTVHARVSVASGASLLAFVAVNAQIKINDQYLGPLDDATANQ